VTSASPGPPAAEPAITQRYLIHGVPVTLTSDPLVAAALQARLGAFPRATGAASALTITYTTVAGPARHLVTLPAQPARAVYESTLGEVLYVDATDQLFIRCGERVRLCYDPGAGQALVSVVQPGEADLWLLTHPLLTLTLMEVLKRHGRYSLHAAGLALGEQALLFPGASGAGKSTLTLALLRAGFGLMGDDLLFLADGAAAPRVLAFPEPVDITDETIALLPELRDLHAAPRAHGWPKRQLYAHERYGARIVWECRPAALIFPRVSGARRSVLTSLDRRQAFVDLAPGLLLTEPASARRYLQAMAALVGVTPCYRLETGSDLAEVATLLRDLSA
jgi:hypothetical protein